MVISGRIHQDVNFNVQGFAGEKIEKILGIVERYKDDNQPYIINLKTTNKTWQRYFIDAGIGFWEDWRELIDELEGKDRFVDYTEIFELKGEKIKFIQCRDSRISIYLKNNNQFILQLINPEKDDTESEIKFVKRNI